jgi:hypothetical protein
MPKPKARKKQPAALPSAALPETHLIEVGARYSGARLVEHAHTVIAKLDSYPFARFGFDTAWTAAVGALIAQIESSVESKAELAADVAPTAEALHVAVKAAKEWRRDAGTTLQVTPTLRARAPSIGTGSSIPKLVASIRKLLPLIAHRDAASGGGGTEMKRQGERLITDLERAQAAHRKAIGKLSPEVRALDKAEGVLYEELRRLARAARRVAPSEAALFAVLPHVITTMPGRRRKADKPPNPA